MAGQFLIPPSILSGPCALNRLADHVAPLGKSVLLVTGRTFARKSGLTDRIVNLLGSAGCLTSVFEDVGPEPDLAACDGARKCVVEHCCEVVIGLGGGSAIDVAKVAAGLARETRPTLDFWLGATVSGPGLPFVAIPTTSGSGAEATVNSVITNPDVPAKRSIRDNGFIPRVAIVDPELVLDCPPEVTAASGMDALCQAIESYTSRHATPLSDSFALRAVHLISEGLEPSYLAPHSLLARTSTAIGSLFAGISMTNARAGVVHGLAHPIGVRLAMPHGRICAILLPLAMKVNRPFAEPKFRTLDSVMGGDADAFVANLLDRFGLPSCIDGQGLKAADYDAIIQEALESGSTKANPKPIAPDDCRAMLSQLFA